MTAITNHPAPDPTEADRLARRHDPPTCYDKTVLAQVGHDRRTAPLDEQRPRVTRSQVQCFVTRLVAAGVLASTRPRRVVTTVISGHLLTTVVVQAQLTARQKVIDAADVSTTVSGDLLTTVVRRQAWSAIEARRQA